VESVLRSPPVARIFIVDNDSSLDFLLPIRDDCVTVIRNARNLGFTSGCNMT